MRMSEKCYNNNSNNPLTSRRTDGGKKSFNRSWLYPRRTNVEQTPGRLAHVLVRAAAAGT